MTLPNGWIPNPPAPETQVPAYTGDQTNTWAAGLIKPGNTVPNAAAPGVQPKSDLNPAGTVNGVPVMTITVAVAKTLSGPQDG